MCAGIRDAANLAWKLAAVLRGQARESLLDSYQTEREPNVRAYIQLAIQMGRVVCALDPAQAKARDAQMLAARAAGVAPIPPASPPPMAGPCILEGTAAAGQMLPQPIVQTERGAVRLDDALGAGPWLICRGAPASAIAGLRAIDLHDPALAPFSTALAAWLNTQEAEAVLVRPDRYVFGTGAPDRLADAWTLALKGAAPIAETAGQTNLAHQ